VLLPYGGRVAKRAGEREAVERSTLAPATVRSLTGDLAALGVPRGGTLLVHSSLRALGWVAGGAEAVVEALLAALGPEGTLVVPSFSTARTDPARWQHPPVPESWWPVIRAETPAFDPRVSSTRQMGVIVDCVLRWPGTVRGPHPHVSLAAHGPLAASIVSPHPLDAGLGDASPMGRLYDLDAHVLLLGVGHGNNSSLHLAETRAGFPGKEFYEEGAAVLVDGERRWVTFTDFQTDDEDFPDVGAAFEASGDTTRVGRVGAGEARLMRQRALVDFAVADLARRRSR
jgi:aminoglycoside 3-N-acetyltransferase